MATTKELLKDFPKTWTLDDKTKVTVRPMQKKDGAKLAALFKRIPEGELRFLKDDVTNKRTIAQWVKNLNYDRVLPFVVEVKGRIIADASLHRRKEGWRRHLGGIRVVVDPQYRHKGIGSRLIDELVAIGRKEGLDRLYAEVPADDQPAIDLFKPRGFTQVALFQRNILDRAGKYHDLAVLHLELTRKY